MSKENHTENSNTHEQHSAELELNNGVEPILARDTLLLLISDIENDSRVAMADLEITYILATVTWADLLQAKKAVAMINSGGPWHSMRYPVNDVTGFLEPENGLLLNDLVTAANTLKADKESLYVRTENIQANVCSFGIEDGSSSSLWLSGFESHGLPFSTSYISIERLEKAFITGEMEPRMGWHLIPNKTD